MKVEINCPCCGARIKIEVTTVGGGGGAGGGAVGCQGQGTTMIATVSGGIPGSGGGSGMPSEPQNEGQK